MYMMVRVVTVLVDSNLDQRNNLWVSKRSGRKPFFNHQATLKSSNEHITLYIGKNYKT